VGGEKRDIEKAQTRRKDAGRPTDGVGSRVGGGHAKGKVREIARLEFKKSNQGLRCRGRSGFRGVGGGRRVV